MNAAEIFAKAGTATVWTRTNLGLTTSVNHAGNTWTVRLPAEGYGAAVITGRDGFGGAELMDVAATPGQTIAVVEAAVSALR